MIAGAQEQVLEAVHAHQTVRNGKGSHQVPVVDKSFRGKFCRFLKCCEEFILPRFLSHAEPSIKNTSSGIAKIHARVRVLLAGCTTPDEHYRKVQRIMDAIENLRGADGLAAAGLEYRTVLCPEHAPPDVQSMDLLAEGGDGDDGARDSVDGAGENEDNAMPNEQGPNLCSPLADVDYLASSDSLWSVRSEDSSHEYTSAHESIRASTGSGDRPTFCSLCHQRLFHIESNNPVSLDNRQQFIADGDMFEAIADLCQEYAHDVMCEEAQMEWVAVEDDDDQDGKSDAHPRCRAICALINSSHPRIETKCQADNPMVGRPTLLIGTGRGKVRAGIFSRKHLMCSNLESSTALPIIREAKLRRLNVVIPDPNAHGERFGYDTFCKTMLKLFKSWESRNQSSCTTDSADPTSSLQENDLYILSHSASGAQIERFLMDHAEGALLVPHIQAVAFTDSTHNIQWAKSPENHELYCLLQSPKCIYFRCSNEQRDNRWYLHATGEEIKTDSFWQHRFGNIKTYWAGTNEHSLTNWYAHEMIMEHFDSYLKSRSSSPPT